MREKRSKKKTIQKYAGILLGLCCLFFLFPLNINAKGKAEIEVIEKNPVTGEKLPGIELSLYKIAEFLNGDYSLPIYEKVFAGLGEDITKLMKEHTNQETAAFLEENIKNSHMKEYEKKTTGEDGRVVFSELEEGIYLLRCTGNENVSYEIEQASVLIQIPMREEQGIQIWNVKLEPKNDVRYPDEQQEMSVVKIWKDNNNKAGKRPEKILVGLYEDNELKEQVELSSKNNWSYEWKQLNKDAVYRVTELQIPEEYEMSVENTEITYTITNTYTKRTEEPHKRKDVKTGDKAEMGVWMLVMLLSLIVICYLHKRENRNGI